MPKETESKVARDVRAFGEFMQATGTKVLDGEGTLWVAVARGVYQAVPFEQRISATAVNYVAVHARGAGVVRHCCIDGEGVPSYRHVIRAPYDMSSLSGKTRNQTRRGCERCRTAPLTSEEVLTETTKLNSLTFSRQGRHLTASRKHYWSRYFAAALNFDQAEYWGAWVGGDLAAFLLAFRIGTTRNILIVRSNPKYLNAYPNNALIYSYVTWALAEADSGDISIGFKPIQGELPGLIRFKEGMGFRREYIEERVSVGSRLGFILWPISRLVVRALLRIGVSSEMLRKLNGLQTIGELQLKGSDR